MSIDDDRHAAVVEVADHGFEETGQWRRQARAEQRVDDQVVRRDLAAMQFPRGLIGDLDDRLTDVAENLEVDPRIALDLAQTPDHEHRHVEAALLQRPGHDETVTAVVALAADDGDAAFGEIGIQGFHGRHHLAAGILHQNQRSDADVLDGASVGLAHLVRVQDAHRSEL